VADAAPWLAKMMISAATAGTPDPNMLSMVALKAT
jgi:hypothetical protein